MLYVTLLSLFIAAASTSPVLWGEHIGIDCVRSDFECEWQTGKEDGLIWQCSQTANHLKCTKEGNPSKRTTYADTNTGSTILLHCGSNAQCLWRYKGNNVNISLPGYSIVDLPNFNCSLRISDIQKSDQGILHCNDNVWFLMVHENKVFTRPIRQPLTQKEGSVTEKKGSVTVKEGSAVILPCGGPNFNATNARTMPVSSHSYSSKLDNICFWMHNNTAIFSHRLADTPGFFILHYGTDYQRCDLFILKVKKEYEGSWFCVRPKSKRQQIHLTVTESINELQPDVTAFQGSSAFLPCPSPRHKKATNVLCFWTHNDTMILHSFNPKAANYEIIFIPVKDSCSLLIHSVRAEDSGAWNCHILGNKTRKLKLAVTSLPDLK